MNGLYYVGCSVHFLPSAHDEWESLLPAQSVSGTDLSISFNNAVGSVSVCASVNPQHYFVISDFTKTNEVM